MVPSIQSNFKDLLDALSCPEKNQQPLSENLTQAAYALAIQNLAKKHPQLTELAKSNPSDKLIDAIINLCGISDTSIEILTAVKTISQRLVKETFGQLDETQKDKFLSFAATLHEDIISSIPTPNTSP